MLVDLFVLTLMLLTVTFIITQCLIPTIVGTHLFPMFRSARKQIVDELETARDAQEIARLQKELHDIKGDSNNASNAGTSATPNGVPSSEASDNSSRPDSIHSVNHESN